jgi:hypothetical protein
MRILVPDSKSMFTAQPEAPAFVLAGASGWAVNGSPQDATLLTIT